VRVRSVRSNVQMAGRRRLKFGYVGLYLLLIAVLTIGSLLIPEGAISPDLVFAPEGRAKIALDVLLDLQQFVGTLNTGLFAACGVLAFKNREMVASWGRIERLSMVGALIAGAVSYFGLYLSRIAVLEMVAVGVIDPISRRLQFALALQYYGFLVGVVLLGLIFVKGLDLLSNDSEKLQAGQEVLSTSRSAE